MISKSRFEQVYKETSVKLRRYVTGMIGRTTQVEDVTQESYFRMLTSAPDRLTDDQLRSYLFTTATNIVRDLWRRGIVAGDWIPLDERTETPLTNTNSIEDKIDVTRILESLTIMQRSLVWLAYAEGYSHREIAEITNIKEKSVKVLLFRARQKFISRLQQRSTLSERNS
jgi:RNA polymerase sigma-70 factor (ECF subfamily)